MKTMTCRQLGGACDLELRGEDHNEVIQAQDQHLKDAVAAGQTDHEPALKEMKARWRKPVSGMKWYKQVERDFAALPDDAEVDGR
jgi:predicted small metal-binding protein